MLLDQLLRSNVGLDGSLARRQQVGELPLSTRNQWTCQIKPNRKVMRLRGSRFHFPLSLYRISSYIILKLFLRQLLDNWKREIFHLLPWFSNGLKPRSGLLGSEYMVECHFATLIFAFLETIGVETRTPRVWMVVVVEFIQLVYILFVHPFV